MNATQKAGGIAIVLLLLIWALLSPAIQIPGGEQIAQLIPGPAMIAFSISITLFFSLWVGFKILEKKRKKKILWKMPLVAFIVSIVLFVIHWIIGFISCNYFTCLGPYEYGMHFLPKFGWLLALEMAFIHFLIALGLYYAYKGKKK